MVQLGWVGFALHSCVDPSWAAFEESGLPSGWLRWCVHKCVDPSRGVAWMETWKRGEGRGGGRVEPSATTSLPSALHAFVAITNTSYLQKLAVTDSLTGVGGHMCKTITMRQC